MNISQTSLALSFLYYTFYHFGRVFKLRFAVLWLWLCFLLAPVWFFSLFICYTPDTDCNLGHAPTAAATHTTQIHTHMQMQRVYVCVQIWCEKWAIALAIRWKWQKCLDTQLWQVNSLLRLRNRCQPTKPIDRHSERNRQADRQIDLIDRQIDCKRAADILLSKFLAHAKRQPQRKNARKNRAQPNGKWFVSNCWWGENGNAVANEGIVVYLSECASVCVCECVCKGRYLKAIAVQIMLCISICACIVEQPVNTWAQRTTRRRVLQGCECVRLEYVKCHKLS